MMRGMFLIAVLGLLAGQPAFAQDAAPMGPAQAIAAASAAGKSEVAGIFEMQIVSTGASGFNVYLNSDADYRNAANLSIELHAGAVNELRKQLGGRPEDLLKGKRVRVKGVARRVPIPRRAGGTYYQTRIDVDSATQIEILG